MADEVSIHVDGRAAIDRIVERIESASHSIWITMFVWRDDTIGNRVCQALLDAANRGVSVSISKDKLAAIFELGEENRQSLFHKNPGPLIRLKQHVINAYSSKPELFRFVRQKPNELAEELKRHGNVLISSNIVKGDHSKYIIVDDRILFFGGVNFEDRAVTCDVLGQKWDDYTIECVSEALVRDLKDRLSGKPIGNSRFGFLVNLNSGQGRFEIKPAVLDLMNSARRSCNIEMAYLGDRDITNAIVDTVNRGVDVRMIIPSRANIQHARNLNTLLQIYRRTNGRASIYLFDNMLHAKMIDVDGECIIIGSANYNPRALTEYAELNARISGNEECAERIRRTFEERLLRSRKVERPEMLAHSRTKALCEKIFG